MTTEALLEKYGGTVPRYTSYPTAPHFRHNPPDSYVAYLLTSHPQDRPVSLYFHIPFCRQLCHYCGCFTKVINHDAPLKEYLGYLMREIKLVGETIGHKALVSHIHFGGGTPNVLEAEDLQQIMTTVKDHFTVLDHAEIAMEIDPRQMSAEKAKDYAALGLNRASLGVQDFQKDVQQAINRIQPYESIVDCVSALRAAGITNINFDLMYGLPLQTAAGIADNIEKTITLLPDRIALFGYAHVPWMRSHQKLLESYKIPDINARFEQQQLASRKLVENGYDAIGMDHFALPGDALAAAVKEHTLKRNFQGYTTDDAEAIIGFGLSAISNYSQAYIQNTTDAKLYKDSLREGKLPLAKGCVLSAEDKMRRDLIQTLMCYFEVDAASICRAHKMDPEILKSDIAALAPLTEDGLTVVSGYKITVTEKGKPFVRVISACFDAYFADHEGTGRHAKAV